MKFFGKISLVNIFGLRGLTVKEEPVDSVEDGTDSKRQTTSLIDDKLIVQRNRRDILRT